MKKLLFLLVLAGCDAPKPPAQPPAPAPLRVLFIGNSFTSWNELPKMVESMSRRPMAVKGVLVDAATLEKHWNDGAARREIEGSAWDVVVLQEQSTRPILAPKLYESFATKFDEVIRGHNAKTVLFLSWGDKGSTYKFMQDALNKSVRKVAAALHAKVAPVGPAWAKALESEKELYYEDNHHPAMAGSYLAACVFVAALTGENPVGRPAKDLEPERAKILQQAAWDAVNE